MVVEYAPMNMHWTTLNNSEYVLEKPGYNVKPCIYLPSAYIMLANK